MSGSSLVFFAIMASIAATVMSARLLAARRGSGLLAQRRFKQLNGRRIAGMLDGSVDPQPGSPWVAIRIDGRAARMVAAPIGRGAERTLQAGIELIDWQLPVQIWLTSGGADDDELEVAAGVDRATAEALVGELHAEGVDSVASPVSEDGEQTGPHVLRMRFAEVDELPDRLTRVGVLLEQLERLAPADADQAPND